MECCCDKHKCVTRKSMQEILKGQGCYYCGLEKLSEGKFLSDDEVQNGINAINPHVKLILYKGHNEKSDFYCTKHNKYFKKFYNNLLYSHSGCDECRAENAIYLQNMGIDEFKRRLNIVHPDLIVLGKYINNSTPIKVRCVKHNYTYSLAPSALLSRKTCCDKTRVTYKEEQVCKLLEEKWGLKITRQKVFDDCKDKRRLPFDIYLDDFNVLIEYQGEQHYRPIEFFGGEKLFQRQQNYD